MDCFSSRMTHRTLPRNTRWHQTVLSAFSPPGSASSGTALEILRTSVGASPLLPDEGDNEDEVGVGVGEAAVDDPLEMLPEGELRLQLRPQSVDYAVSLARYRATAEMTVLGEWMQPFVVRGAFNLGYMHQFGLGVAQDFHMRRYL